MLHVGCRILVRQSRLGRGPKCAHEEGYCPRCEWTVTLTVEVRGADARRLLDVAEGVGYHYAELVVT